MAEKHLVVQGAVCQCKFGTTPDKLKVNTHTQEYVNDKDGVKKPVASTKDIGTTFEKNNFGSCSKKNNNPCTVNITEWKGFYDHTVLTNGGKILLEDSSGTCAVGGPESVKFINHGQIAQVGQQNFNNAQPEVMQSLNPAVDSKQVTEPEFNADGITLS